MLLITPENAIWRRWSYWPLIGLSALYAGYAMTQYPHGGSMIGISYGVLGLIIILILMYFGVRKRQYQSSFGTLQSWLHSHIYLGILVFVIILFHSGFRFHDKIAVSAFVLLTVVVASGILGAVLYTVVPPKLINVEANLSAGEISEQINQLAQSMSRLASHQSGAFQRVCDYLIESEHPGPSAGWRILFSGLARQRLESNAATLNNLIANVHPDENAQLTQLLVLARQRTQLHDRLIRKQKYINIMAVWLYIHLPISFAMMAAVVAHIAAFFWYW